MTVKELRELAKSMGYRIYKIPPTETLHICPLCGGKPWIRYESNKVYAYCRYKCNDCNSGPDEYVEGRVAAKKMWNKWCEEQEGK